LTHEVLGNKATSQKRRAWLPDGMAFPLLTKGYREGQEVMGCPPTNRRDRPVGQLS